MAAVQEGILSAVEVSTSWSQSLKCTVLKRLIKVTSHHHTLSKPDYNYKQAKKSFESFSQHILLISLPSISDTAKREFPRQH